MFGALKALLEGRNEIDQVSCQLVQADDHVRRQLLPLSVGVLALVAEEAAVAAVARWLSFFALVAFSYGRGAHLPEDVSDVEQAVHEESSLQARDFALGQTARLAVVGALDGQALRALAVVGGTSRKRRGSTGAALGARTAPDTPHTSTALPTSGGPVQQLTEVRPLLYRYRRTLKWTQVRKREV